MIRFRLALVVPVALLAACARGDGSADTAGAAAPADSTMAASGDAACWVRGDASRLSARPSPLDSASVDLAAGTVKVCYGRPSKNGREIMGGLVPYGSPWRLGANEATTIHVPAAATIAGVPVEPGWYSLYAIPGERTWQIVVNRTSQRWGIPIDSAVRAADVGTGEATPTEAPQAAEQLTLSFERTGDAAADLLIDWDRTRVRVPVTMGR